MCQSMGKGNAGGNSNSNITGPRAVSTLKPGDWIDGHKVQMTDSGYKRAEDYAYWTTTRQDGTKSRGDYKQMALTVQKVEPKGDKIKVTATLDLADLYPVGDTENRKKAPKRLLTRTFNKDDMLKVYARK